MNEPNGHDNRSNQMNPNNDAFWQARGWTARPADWKSRYSGKEHPQPANQQGQEEPSKLEIRRQLAGTWPLRGPPVESRRSNPCHDQA